MPGQFVGVSFEPYDELGRILAVGGEMTVVRGMIMGRTEAQIRSTLGRKVAAFSDETFAKLATGARAIIAAGGRVGALEPGELISAANIPINSALFADDTVGRRIRLLGHVFDENGMPTLEIVHDLPDFTSLDQLLHEISEYIHETAKKYADFAARLPLEFLFTRLWRVSAIEARF